MESELRRPFTIFPHSTAPEADIIGYLYPQDEINKLALGYDMFTEENRRMAMMMAAESGEATASAKVKLIQDVGPAAQAGFLIYLPLYTPSTARESRSPSIKGFLYSAFQADDLLRNIMGASSETLVDFKVYDGDLTTRDNLLHDTARFAPTLPPSYQPHFHSHRSFSVAGRTWTVIFTPRPEFGAVRFHASTIWLGGMGLAVALLFFGTGWISAVSHRRVLGQREWLRVTLASIGDAVIATDSHGCILFLNTAAEKLTGLSQSASIGLPLHRVLVMREAESGNPITDLTGLLLRNHENTMVRREVSVVRDDGEVLTVEFSASPIRDAARRVAGTIFALHDVSARKERERLESASADIIKILAYSRSLEEVAEQLVSAICGALLCNGGVLWTFDEAERVPRCRAALGVSGDLKDFVEPVLQSSEPSWVVNVDRRSAVSGETDKPQIFGTVITAPLLSQGRVRGAVSVFSFQPRPCNPDGLHWLTSVGVQIGQLAERREAEQDRMRLLESERAARSQLERASKIKDEFLATLSHELRTPLNAILGWAQLIRRGGVPSERLRQGVEVIEKNAIVQAQMINDLLDMSRIVSGKIRLEAKSLAVASLVASAVQTITPTAQAKGIRLNVHIESNVGTVTGDSMRLQQVLWNLLSNAVRFSRADSTIDVNALNEGDNVVVVVRDYGEGIRPDFLPHVFDRFRQADASTTRRHGGLGLGLSIVKQLVELHGGTIAASSAGSGSGATFTVRLPRSGAAGVTQQSYGAAVEGSLHPYQTERLSLEGVKVLAIDDEEDARNLLRAILEGEGALVTTASSSQRGLVEFEATRPDLIVSDISMPEEDGYQFIKQVRAKESHQGGHTPAIALTAFARLEDREQALAAGFEAHLAKPIEPSALVATAAHMAHRPSQATR
jgi:PAS domain S-box-containing protein